MSLAQLPDKEFDTLQSARYPRVSEVLRRWKEHTTRFPGHSDPGNGWRGAFIFDVVLQSGYGFLKGNAEADL